MNPFHGDQPLSEVERFAALSRIGTALISERDEGRLLQRIAQTAVDLMGAEFAAFTLRPVNEHGELSVPSEGHLFHLAAVIGVTQEQEELFRRVPLGGEGLLAPIFRHGKTVRVADALKSMRSEQASHTQQRSEARDAALAFVHGQIPTEALRSVGIPHGHPLIRSFLGAPLLDSEGAVRGGLLLGHSQPDRFRQADEEILTGLAAQAAVAVENMRLYQAMRTQAQELQAIFESIADGVTLVDHQGTIIRENHCARQLREQVEGYLQGKEALEALLHAPARSALEGMIEHDVSVTIVDEHNEYHEFLVNASPLHQQANHKIDGQGPLPERLSNPRVVSGAVVVWHDVTESRRLLRERRLYAEAEARRALLQRLLDEMPSSVYLVHGKDARLVLANHAVSTVWGARWSREQPMVEFLQEQAIHILSVDGRPLPTEQFATLRAVQGGETVYQHQEVIRRADGSSLPVLVNAIALDTQKFPIHPPALPQEEQEPIALVVHQDVTALKEAETLKDEFIGIAAHELRNPLAALHGFVQLLQAEFSQREEHDLTAWQQELLEGVGQGTRRLVDLTEDLLDVTRLHAGRLELREDATDLVALVTRMVRRAQMTTEQHQLYLTSSAEFLVARIDAQRIEQVVTNILNNAIKYSPSGGSIEICLGEDQETHCAILSVKDVGIGIPVQQQARIFGRFVRAENAQAQGIYGTGLGLYLSRELVEQQGGRIWFHSVEGEGSKFFVALPLVSDGDDEEQEESTSA